MKLLEDFLDKGPFGPDWKAKDALNCLKNYREQLKALREKEAQLRKDLALFDISLPESLELARLERVKQQLVLVTLYADVMFFNRSGIGCFGISVAAYRRMGHGLGEIQIWRVLDHRN